MVDVVRTERREDGEVALVLEEEAKVAKGLTGGVTRGEVVAEDSIEDESIAFGCVRVQRRRRKGLVLGVGDVRRDGEDALALDGLVVLLGGTSAGVSTRVLPDCRSVVLGGNEPAEPTPWSAD